MLRNLNMKKKFLFVFLAIFFVMTSWNLILMLRTDMINKAYHEIISNVVKLNEVDMLLDESMEELEEYLTRKLYSNNGFNRKLNELYESVNALSDVYPAQEEQLAYRNLRQLLITLDRYVNESIWQIQGRNPSEAMQCFETAKDVVIQMKEVINYLVFQYMQSSKIRYDYLVMQTERTLGQSLLVWGMILMLCGTAAWLFARSIMASLNVLAGYSMQIAQAPENARPVAVTGKDEFAVLTDSLNQMGSDIKKYIKTLREKADLEKELQETELKNLSMENMLSRAELLALQSQINPHFLFNTLNIVAQMAMIEEADATYELTMNLSKMFRYNLRNLDTPVLLKDEIENLKRYVYIQRARYGETVNYQIEIQDSEMSGLPIPCLSLQPIVENSVIHGFDNGNGKGNIRIAAWSDHEFYHIVVEDDGKGMDEKSLEHIQNSQDMPGRGHTSGLGIRNVIFRLRLFYEYEVLHIRSSPGEGTCVEIRIPKDNKKVRHERGGEGG